MTEAERRELLGDEWLIVRNSGEIPEITYHSCLYYLETDSDGPALRLSDEERQTLKEAALERYYEIILRDLTLDNFHKSIYRGVRRTIYNWQRCRMFSLRQGISCEGFRENAGQALLLFLREGRTAVGSELPENFINCTAAELYELAAELSLKAEQLPPNIDSSCLQERNRT
ncbi:MAG: hypothetical protein ABFR63_01520 [Thermodesulfobacteriota bacterium]